MTAPAEAESRPPAGPGAGSRRSAPVAENTAPVVLAVVDVVGLVVLGVALGLGFDRVFADAPLLRLSVGAAVGAAIVGEVAGRVARATLTGTLLASLVGLVLATPPVVSGSAPTPGAVTAALADLGDAPRRILSVPLPVAPEPPLVIVVFVSTWLAVALAVELARRSRDPFLPILPLGMVAVAPPVLGAGGPAPGEGRWTLVLLVAAAVVLARTLTRRPGAHSSERSRRLVRRRRLLAGLPLLALVVLLAPAAAPHVPGLADRRLELRSVVDATTPEVVTSPLAQVDVLAGQPRGTLAFSAEGPGDPVRFHLAVLDHYDGSQWSAPNGSVRVAERFPETDEPVPGQRVSYEVTLGDLGTAFLPVPGRAVELTGPSVLLDQRTGNVRLRTSPEEGLTYRVTGVVPTADDAAVARASRATSGAEVADASAPIPNSEILGALAVDRARGLPVDGAGLSGDVRQLKALQAFLADPEVFAYADEARGGESLAHLTRLLAGSSEAGGEPGEASLRQGSRQQFVAGFAVMARTLGFPARVAVGYVYNGTGPITFDTKDITAWVEVKLAGVGWVPFDVGPDESAIPPDVPVEQSEDRSTVDPATPTTLPVETGDDERVGSGAGDGGRPWFAAVTVVVVLVLVAAGLRRPARRWRRRRGDPRARVLGAWAEAVDIVSRAGPGRDATRTVSEVTSGATPVLAPEGHRALVQLGDLATRTSWAPGGPDDTAAIAAWGHVAEVRRHLRPRRDRRADMVPARSGNTLGSDPQ